MLTDDKNQNPIPEYVNDPLYKEIKEQFDAGKMDQEQFDSLVQGAFPTPENVKLQKERLFKAMYG